MSKSKSKIFLLIFLSASIFLLITSYSYFIFPKYFVPFNPIYFFYFASSGFLLSNLLDVEEYKNNLKRQTLFLTIWIGILLTYLLSTISVNLFLILPFREFDYIVYQLSTINDIPTDLMFNPIFLLNTFIIPFMIGFSIPSLFLEIKEVKPKKEEVEVKRIPYIRV